MATKYDQSSATRPVSIRSHTSAFQVHFKHTSSALEMSSVNPPNDALAARYKGFIMPDNEQAIFCNGSDVQVSFNIFYLGKFLRRACPLL